MWETWWIDLMLLADLMWWNIVDVKFEKQECRDVDEIQNTRANSTITCFGCQLSYSYCFCWCYVCKRIVSIGIWVCWIYITCSTISSKILYDFFNSQKNRTIQPSLSSSLHIKCRLNNCPLTRNTAANWHVLTFFRSLNHLFYHCLSELSSSSIHPSYNPSFFFLLFSLDNTLKTNN